ncbi:cytochrome P450 [Pterulicium gracile]|uniref:Cytochrome P450 n=1 Tax=Pterulicium gracile TaxID=1884261 RepID=A0A5C3QQ59_9AGAR|nr:cytochrome P450 [Pterula gracilis]
MPVPPGIRYLSQRSPYLLGPPTLFYIAYSFAVEHVNEFQRWHPALVVLGCVMSLPGALTLWCAYESYVNRRDAWANGAVLPPSVGGYWPGNLPRLMKTAGDFKNGYVGNEIQKVTKEYGNTFNFRTLFTDRIFTVEPENIKSVLASQFNDFEKGPVVIRILSGLFGTGVFNSDGDMWKFHRQMTRPFFSKERITDFEIFDIHATETMHKLKSRLKEGFPVDFQDLSGRYTLDSATSYLFGKEVGTLSASLAYPHNSPKHIPLQQSSHPADQFLYAFQETQNISAYRVRFGEEWQLGEFWKDRNVPHLEVIDGFIEPILRDAVRKKQTGEKVEKGGEAETTLLDYLVTKTEDHTTLRDETFNLLVAARDTTSSLLTFVVYMLAEHPDVLRRLREEILDQVGPTNMPTYDDVRVMKFLRAVLNETLRFFAPVPFNIRTCKNATLWASKVPGEKPMFIPAGTRIPYSVLIMHRREDLWGPDAGKWDPDRFIDERVERLTANPFIFLPFNAGPRICLGQQFAYNEASFFLVRLLQNFSEISLALDAVPPEHRPRDEWKDGGEGFHSGQKVWARAHITMYASGGLWVNMKEASY